MAISTRVAREMRRGIKVAREVQAKKRIGPYVSYDDASPFGRAYLYTLGGVRGGLRYL